MRSVNLPTRPDRVYRLLLRLLPRELREESGEEMSELFREYRSMWAGRRGGALRVWSVALRDILVQATAARFERKTQADSGGRRRAEQIRGDRMRFDTLHQDLRHEQDT